MGSKFIDTPCTRNRLCT